MAKLSITQDPTFSAKVGIPRAGKPPVDVTCEFKFRTRTEFNALLETHKNSNDVDYLMEFVVGWDVDAEFSKDNLRTFLENYGGAATAIASKYTEELLPVKLGN